MYRGYKHRPQMLQAVQVHMSADALHDTCKKIIDEVVDFGRNGEKFHWDKATIDISTTLYTIDQDRQSWSLLENAIRRSDVATVTALWKTRQARPSPLGVESLKYGGVDQTSFEKNWESRRDVKKRNDYKQFLQCIRVFFHTFNYLEIESWDRSLKDGCLRGMWKILDKARMLLSGDYAFYVRFLEEIFVALDFRQHLGEVNTEDSYYEEISCFHCKLFRSDEGRQLLTMLLQYGREAIEQLMSIAKSFLLLDTIKFCEDDDGSVQAMSLWCPGFEKLRSSIENLTIFELAMQYSLHDLVSYILRNVPHVDLGLSAAKNSPNALFYALLAVKDPEVMISEVLNCVSRAYWTKLLDHPQNENGQTVLHLAAAFDKIAAVKQLCISGACYTKKDGTSARNTARNLSMEKGHASLVEFFDSVDEVFTAAREKNVKKYHDLLNGTPELRLVKYNVKGEENVTAPVLLHQKKNLRS